MWGGKVLIGPVIIVAIGIATVDVVPWRSTPFFAFELEALKVGHHCLISVTNDFLEVKVNYETL
jgi:hypothetical protein